jgi:hypothetical protein
MQVVQCVIFAVIASMHTGLICDGDAGDSGERTALNPWSGDSDISAGHPVLPLSNFTLMTSGVLPGVSPYNDPAPSHRADVCNVRGNVRPARYHPCTQPTMVLNFDMPPLPGSRRSMFGEWMTNQ